MALPGNATGGLSAVVFDSQSHVLAAAGGALATGPGALGMQRELIAWELPGLRVRWQVLAKARSRFCQVAAQPDGAGFITDDGDVKLSLWNADGELLRTVRGEFLAGPIAVSANRTTFVAPVGNRVTLRDTSSGEPIGSITISDDKYCSATAACFVRGQSLILIAAAVINNKGHTFGQLSVADYEKREVLYDAPLDMHPLCIAVDVQFRWACIAGKRRGRGYIQFLDCSKWQPLKGQAAHRGEVRGLAVSPDGALLATCGNGSDVHIWRTDNFKMVATLEQHRCNEQRAANGVAWSPDGQWIAYANAGGIPPAGGVFLYERIGDLQWRLRDDTRTTPADDKAKRSAPRSVIAANTLADDAEVSQWLTTYLAQHAAAKPLATLGRLQAWQRQHQIKLPADYTRFASTIGRHEFANVQGLEGLNLSVVGPAEIDDIEYRRDPAGETSTDELEPDGLMFAVATNGDCLCFDIRSGDGAYPVYYFDHETERFTWFASSFAAAIRRLAAHEP